MFRSENIVNKSRIALLGLVLIGCAGNYQNLRENYDHKRSRINMTDGIDENEALILAKDFILTTDNTECSIKRNYVDVKKPKMYSENKINYVIIFRWKGFKSFYAFPLGVEVNKSDGNVECVGGIVVK